MWGPTSTTAAADNNASLPELEVLSRPSKLSGGLSLLLFLLLQTL
jgi:hypothetical protein